MAEIRIEPSRCIGCAACVPACPFGQITVAAGLASVAAGCTGCAACLSACPMQAITQPQASALELAPLATSGVWVFAEQAAGRPRKVVLELLGEANKLAALRKTNVTAVIFGKDLAAANQQLLEQGAARVIVADHPALAQYNDELYAGLLSDLISKHRPEIVLIGATGYGRSLAPRVASRLQTGLTADCTTLDIDQVTGLLLQTRPAFGGNLMATIVCPNHRPQMATVRPQVMQALPPDKNHSGLIIPVDYQLPEELSTQVLAVWQTVQGSTNLAEAEVVVAVGRGIGSAANLGLCQELATALGGVLGATRPVVDAGWVDYSRQIGQTGRTVAPRLYLACGISGAVQHLAGMSAAETIVAINKDKDAPIFRHAHFGIVGDVLEVIPELLQILGQRH